MLARRGVQAEAVTEHKVVEAAAREHSQENDGKDSTHHHETSHTKKRHHHWDTSGTGIMSEEDVLRQMQTGNQEGGNHRPSLTEIPEIREESAGEEETRGRRA
ncbi:hypothetical protein QBC35DRAFT_455286 [Podospora australis]|uniref:EF-hand domain-containing protein n=1 Tax=Podospora australis TaxID=1536484 RepID=A0AAN7AEN8_9PEZI|nr:hypothetical protein QBC35DRAFT_455286 [Podospora australis]